jgi:hypothetical protein
MVRTLLEERRRTKARIPAIYRPEFDWQGLVEETSFPETTLSEWDEKS